MKYLQLYDHLGNLVREFEVYVDGQDFNWAAPKPEPVWLGTIRLVAEKAVSQVEPTPEAVLIEVSTAETTKEVQIITEVPPVEREPEPEAEKVPEGYEDVMLECPDCGWKGKRSETTFGHDDFICPKCQVQSLKEVSEVKHEPTAEEILDVAIAETEVGEIPVEFTPEQIAIENEYLVPKSEVKHEPEKRSDKSRRAKGTRSQSRSKRT